MSYQYTVTERRKRTSNSGGYGHSGNRSAFGYWIPLTLTVTAAAIGVAAWIWSERRDDEVESSEDEHYPGGIPPPGYSNMSGALPPQAQPFPGGFQGPGPGPQQPGGFGGPSGPPPGAFQGPPPTGPLDASGEYRSVRSTAIDQQEESGLVARVSSAFGFGRSTSPVPPNDWASKTIAAGAAGVAAAGAMVGGAISSLTGGSGGYEDHERWSEEAEQRDNDREITHGIKRRGTAEEFFSGAVGLPKSASVLQRKRKTVAIVVSAVEETPDSEVDVGGHASILAHLPDFVDPDTTRVFILIYTPDLKAHPLSPVATRGISQSMASSFSNISHHDAQTPSQTPGDFPADGILSQVEPNPIDETTTLYKTLHNQAMAIVDKDSMIMPFTSPSGHKHLLRSLAPEVVYIQESLCGRDGEIVADLSGWVRQTVVVIGDEGGHGGLIDTDDESTTKRSETWWQREERTGLGKRVTVVESLKIGEDWQRRVNERD
ncbi:uncharacterized protein A1O9_10646 [Exophiala aquamarina CBS 119918]|uniref:Peroxin-22-like protein Pex22-like-Penicillium chrysogenum n=1 Tax=Exophiala aquamarina CBS 119918 TaxID=1182545 RepID=A0A072P1P8_9EURO|nr:uncharacterized protein A1O9_10646 [Exophiala aquamarina CBS 119918]KEF53198.1 hypothetical protein A1O9_10646 [Exophiala aquamarina CBS 119918]